MGDRSGHHARRPGRRPACGRQDRQRRARAVSGSGEWVTLPNNITSTLTGDWSISAWVNPQANTTWSRICDFGTGTTNYMFLTVSAGSAPRFAITTGGGGGEQVINGHGLLPLNQWSHVAVTVSGTTGTLYVNGTAVGTNANVTVHPSQLGNTTQNWIGRSQYGDPLLHAQVDDFNIYGRALSAAEVATLAGGHRRRRRRRRLPLRRGQRHDRDRLVGATRKQRARSPPAPPITCPGKVFLQSDLTTGNLVCWKDQQNFAPFIDGIAPDTPEYTQALRYYADKAQFPIMPVYTANQADKAEAAAHGSTGTNNFSNINATLQARLYSKALRDYPSQYITPGHVPQAHRVAQLERVHRRRQPVPGQQRVLLQLGPDDPDAGPLGHPPRRARLVQLDDLPGRRRPAAAPRRPAGALPDRHGVRPLHGQQPQLPRHRASRSCGRSRAARRTTRRRRWATRSTSAAGGS